MDKRSEEKINEFAIEALSVLSKVLHALQHSNLKGTILHQEISAVIKKGKEAPINLKNNQHEQQQKKNKG